MAQRILIISASMGAGHDGAARELARRLETEGHESRVVDFLACLPGIGGSIKRVFQFQLSRAPWSYEALYRVFFRLRSLHRPLTWLTTLLSSRRVRQQIAEMDATAVVTTYPLASLILGRERQRGRICVPVATFVTDFGVHPLWVHPGVDGNFCVHPDSAEQAALATGKPSASPGPMVPQRFSRELPDRLEARRTMGIPAGLRSVLVVAGSWGVGDLEKTVGDLLGIGGVFPVVACGSNEVLRASLQARTAPGRALVLGWTDQMPALMAACDVLLQNAGGLTCMEAFAAGLPVLTYRPIPGHGIENAMAMERAGVARYVRASSELSGALSWAIGPGGRWSIQRGRAIFQGDASSEILGLCASVSGTPAPAVPSMQHRTRARVGPRRVATVIAAASMLYAGFTYGANAAVAHGFDVARPEAGLPLVYVGVRLGNASVSDPAIAALLADDGITAIVPGSLASSNSHSVSALAAAGVDLANGGDETDSDALDLALPDTGVPRSAHAIAGDSGVTPRHFVPGSGINGFALAGARLMHESVVHPTEERAAGMVLARVRAGGVYVIDARLATPADLITTVASIERAAESAGLTVTSFRSLG